MSGDRASWASIDVAGLIDIYTDGACSGNPGPGGWGALLTWRGHERELSGGAGYLSQDSPILHFGMAQATKADVIEIHWPGGSLSKS